MRRLDGITEAFRDFFFLEEDNSYEDIITGIEIINDIKEDFFNNITADMSKGGSSGIPNFQEYIDEILYQIKNMEDEFTEFINYLNCDDFTLKDLVDDIIIHDTSSDYYVILSEWKAIYEFLVSIYVDFVAEDEYCGNAYKRRIFLEKSMKRIYNDRIEIKRREQ